MLGRTRTTLTVAVGGLVAGALAVAGVPAQAAPAGAARGSVSAGPGAGAPRSVRSDTSPGPRVLTTQAGRPLARPAGLPAGASAATIATAVVTARADELGVRGTLRTASVRAALGGGSVVRLQQTFDGVPVMGGEVVVDVDAAGRTRSAISETLGSTPSTTAPAVDRSEAARQLTGLASKHSGLRAALLRVGDPVLALYDPALLGAPALAGAPGARLVWRSEVSGVRDPSVRRLLILDASSGALLLDLDLINHALDRTVCDAELTPEKLPCTTAAAARVEGSPADAQQDVNLAYEYAGKTYEFYRDILGRSSIDGHDMPLLATVRWCPDLNDPTECPSFANAFWNGSQMVYGDGYASADDVVAHELTHGVTERVNGLYYYFQSGAINESLSDIFGEFVDLTDGVGNDDASVRWKLGEDLPHTTDHPAGYIRDMKNPPLLGDPDSTQSALYKARVLSNADSFDSGGVHENSGVGNKFAYLLTDGATFNGVVVSGIGITKAAKIIYGASQRMTSATDYRGFAAALRASCTALVGTAGIDATDCQQVTAAIRAVDMDLTPRNAATPRAGYCSAGYVTSTRYRDTMENPSAGRWARSGSPFAWPGHPTGTPLWFFGTYDNPTGSKQIYATSGTNNLWGMDPPAASVHDMRMTSSVAVPSGISYLRFDHAFGFETDTTSINDKTIRNFDGGVVEYSTNGGRTWTDAGGLMAGSGNNAYGFNYNPSRTSVLAKGYGNALGGRRAFSGQSQGYVSSRANLSSLAGKSLRFRFRIGADTFGGDQGWYIDNVEIYSCLPLVSAVPSLVTGPSRVTWPASDPSHPSTKTYRLASAAFGQPLSAYDPPIAAPASRSLTLVPPRYGTACILMLSRDTATGALTQASRCATAGVDDRSLKASAGWKKQSSASAFAKTLRVATKKGRTLTLSGARGGHVTVLARAVKNGGKVGVYVNGRKIATISLSAKRTTAKRYDYAVAGLVGGSSSVKLKVLTKNKPVTIDALGVRL